MFFTVVIPTHKRKSLLLDLLESLEKQTFDKNLFEIKIIATENDETFSIDLSTFKNSIEITSVENDPTKGRSASIKRNYGARLADSEWIAFTDDDCVASPGWLQEAYNKIQQQPIDFLEGAVNIPVPEKKTFTYKGIQRLSRPGGFQTCNMFYRKKDFTELSGFDPNFPYYLEDTDLAWTFKEAHKKSGFAEKAFVSHPVPKAAPHKMLESAWRMEKLPYLYKKHPKTFKESHMRALPRPYFVLACLDLFWSLALLVSWQWSLGLLFLRLLATDLLLFRMLKGCDTDLKEIASMYYYLLICPLISLFQLIRGNIKQGVWIFLR